MKRNIAEFGHRRFDLVIVGGGITGSFLALDASARGLSVALLEKGDFGAATSAASSKLLHGGIRYLQQADFRKVRESALERARFRNLAPHLTLAVPFLVPTYRGLLKGRAFLSAGLLAYELLSLGANRLITDPARRIGRPRSVSAEEVRGLIPGNSMAKVTGGMVFDEIHMHSSERMTLAVLDTAVRRGAVVGNYLRVDRILVEDGRVNGVQATDLVHEGSFEVEATLVINAAGPWIPYLNGAVSGRRLSEIVTGFSKGAHIVTKPLTNGYAVALTTAQKNQGVINRGGRHIFIIPWRDHSLIGTTYAPYEGSLDEVCATEIDIAELVSGINSGLGSTRLARADVKHAFAGVYPLIEDKINPNVYQGTGEYQVVDHAIADNLEGLVSVFGAKFTTARLVAERAMALVATKLGCQRNCQPTRDLVLAAGEVGQLETFRQVNIRRYAEHFSEAVITRLVDYYGAAIADLMELILTNQELRQPLVPGCEVLAGEAVYATRNEMVMHVDDFVFRRTGLGTLGHPGEAAIRRCAELIGDELGWSQSKRQAETGRALQRFFS